MKKLSIDFGEGGFKGFMLRHFEKASLAVVGLLSVYFIYLGATREGYQKGGPLQLKGKAASALEHVLKDTSLTLMEEQQRTTVTDHLARVDEAAKPTESASYVFGEFNSPLFSPKSKRRDPKIYAVESLEVASFFTSVYEKTTTADPFAGDSVAAGKAGVAAPPRPPMPPKNPPRKKGGEGGGGDLLDRVNRNPPPVVGNPANEGMARIQNGVGSLGRNYVMKYIHGFRPMGAADGVRGISRSFNVVMGLLPVKKFESEFEAVLASADGYELARDLPNYLALRVERAEVGADPKAPLEWVRLSVPGLRTRMNDVWMGTTPEIADARYLDPKLSFPMPPAMMVPPEKLGLHSKVPRASLKVEAADEKEMPEKDAKEKDAEDEFGGAGKMEERRGGAENGMERRMPRPGMPNVLQRPGQKPAVEEKVDFKMVRFYDFETEPGKAYCYRLQILIEDPNRPLEAQYAPTQQMLDQEVLKRLATVEAKDNASGKRTAWRETPWSESSAVVRPRVLTNYAVGPIRFQRTIPLVDPTTKTKTFIKPEELSGTMLVSVWDRVRATELTGNPDLPDDPRDKPKPSIYFGTMLNFFKDMHYLRPDTLQILLGKTQPFRTNTYVVDMRPNEVLPIARTGAPGKLETASEILLMEANGQLKVHNELDDVDNFRRLTFEGELNSPPAAGGG